MKAFIYAMEKECAPLKEKTSLLRQTRHGAASFEWRRSEDKEFLLIVSGIGKTLSAMAVSAIPFLEKKVTSLLSLGVSGSLCDDLSPFTFFVPDRFVHHDIDTSAFGDPKGLFFNPSRVYFEADLSLHQEIIGVLGETRSLLEGVEVAGDSFVAAEDKKRFLENEWHAKGCDMETASEASVASLLGIPFAALRIVSDSSSGASEYEKNLKKAVSLLSEKALRLI